MCEINLIAVRIREKLEFIFRENIWWEAHKYVMPSIVICYDCFENNFRVSLSLYCNFSFYIWKLHNQYFYSKPQTV